LSGAVHVLSIVGRSHLLAVVSVGRQCYGGDLSIIVEDVGVLGGTRDGVCHVTLRVWKCASKEEESEGAVKTFGDDVQDGEPQVLVIDRNDVASIGESPADGIDCPQDDEEGGLYGVGAACVVIEELSKVEDDNVKDGEESQAAHSEPDPSGTSTHRESSKESSDDHDDVQNDDQTGECGSSASKRGQFKEEERCGYGPIDVSGVIKLSSIFFADIALLECHGHVGGGRHRADDDRCGRELSYLLSSRFDHRDEEDGGR